MSTLTAPEPAPSPVEDCEAIRKAFQGLVTDEKAIIRILGHRDASHRKKIRETYQQLYHESLVDQLNYELFGDFRKAVVLWTYDPPERDARLANEALKSERKSISELQVIVEIACAASPHHLVAIRQAYCSLFHCSLEEDIISEAPLPVQKILVSLVSSYRYDKEVEDSSITSLEAAKLHDAIGANKLDDMELVRILSTRNMFQLQETFKWYKNHYGKSIDQDIMACGEGILVSVLKVVICCINSPQKHFAKVIRTTILGLGTDEDSLTRAVVARAEIDLLHVRTAYFNSYESSMEDAIVGDTSWSYKDFLLTLFGADI